MSFANPFAVASELTPLPPQMLPNDFNKQTVLPIIGYRSSASEPLQNSPLDGGNRA